MAEIFSTVAAGIALVANLKDLCNYLKDIKAGIGSVHDDVDSLQKELESLTEVCQSVVHLRKRQQTLPSPDPEQVEQWNGLGKPLETMKMAIQDFDTKLRKVFGDDPKRRAWKESFKKWHRFKDVEPALGNLRSTISSSKEKITIWMQVITINKQDFAHDQATVAHNENMVAHEEVMFAHEEVMAKLTNLGKAIEAGNALPQTSKKNRHFAIPKAVESHYLGREVELDTLAQAFWPKAQAQNHEQKRFVIHGVGGSGKTQFCSKYAQEYRERYWGVFWVDGASADRLKDSLVLNVAHKGGVGEKHEAALHWLSNQNEDWLLIIDNADDPDLGLMEFFPKGANGHVLITTRDQDCALGNVGSMSFYGMHETDASELFFKVANVKESAENKSLVRDILNELGHLALAIVVAGSAIHQGYCKLKEYLTYLEGMWRRRRPKRSVSGLDESPEKEREGRVEAQFDMSLHAIKRREVRAIEQGKEEDAMAARDAPELLRTFAFMNREKVRFEFLKLCAENAKKEQVMAETETEGKSTAQSWRQYFFEALVWVHDLPKRHPSSTILPNVLREARETGCLDGERVRRAMRYLRSYSLVTYDDETDSWSMHPLIHRWARQGFESNPGEHHVWLDAAATLVSSCVVLNENAGGNEELMRQLLPHVTTVREQQEALNSRITHNRLGRYKLWPLLDWGGGRHMLIKFVKFSIVFLSVGMFQQASELLRIVHRALESLLGYENWSTRRITILTAQTLWALSEADESARLLELLRDNCQRIFGLNHRETHKASICLAEARLQQGRVVEARDLCDRSIPGLEKACGPEDATTLKGLDIQAMAVLLTGKSGAVEQAKSILLRTWKTREKNLGADHVDTLTSRRSFYATSFWHGNNAKHREAELGMSEIVHRFKEKLGPEHPFTLLSMLYLARVKVELQDFDGAQEQFDYGLPIAERNLGKEHIAVLFCRYHIGRMRVRQERWKEARDELVDVSEKQSESLQGWGRFHYDRIGTLLELARAHHELGEDEECDAVVDEAFRAFKYITSSVHPWEEKLRADWEDWKKQRTSSLRCHQQPLLLPTPKVTDKHIEIAHIYRSSTF
ncbi:unnamed protein product [Alternaria burnsii]|nr:unnamed protein product [Alternaria burnsii]